MIKKVLNVFAIITFIVSIMLNLFAVLLGTGFVMHLTDLRDGKVEKIPIGSAFSIIKEPNIKVVK